MRSDARVRAGAVLERRTVASGAMHKKFHTPDSSVILNPHRAKTVLGNPGGMASARDHLEIQEKSEYLRRNSPK